MRELLDFFVFGCRHRRETRPLRRRSRTGELLRSRPSYVACLACGRERDCPTLDPEFQPRTASSGWATQKEEVLG